MEIFRQRNDHDTDYTETKNNYRNKLHFT